MCRVSTPTPQVPELPPARAMERMPNRGTLAPEARRQIEATYGTRNQPATILGQAQRIAIPQGVVRSSSSANTAIMSSILGG